MKKEPDKVKISIQYKNDKEAKNNLIEFIIDFLLENNNLAGDSALERNDSDV